MTLNTLTAPIDSASEFHKIQSRPASIEVKDVSVSFKTPKGVFTAIKNIDLTTSSGCYEPRYYCTTYL